MKIQTAYYLFLQKAVISRGRPWLLILFGMLWICGKTYIYPELLKSATAKGRYG